jgi:hypothetical protein
LYYCLSKKKRIKRRMIEKMRIGIMGQIDLEERQSKLKKKEDEKM